MRWSPNANMYVTSSKDGDIKLWDGVGNVVINTFTKAHEGNEVCSVAFSRNGKVCVVKCSQVFSCFFFKGDNKRLLHEYYDFIT